MSLQKGWALLVSSFMASLQYRAELVVWVLLSIIPTVVLFLTWTAIYQGQTNLQGLSLGQVVQYYLLALFIDGVISAHFESRSVQNIRQGEIDHRLTKPISYSQQLFFHTLGGKLFYLLIAAPLLILLALVTSTLTQTPLVLNPTNLFNFSLLLVYGYLIEFMLSYMVVMAGFWFEEADGLQHFKLISISLFSGAMIPLAFMPDWLAYWFNLLPFKYLYAIPIAIFQNQYQLTMMDVIIMIAFLGGLTVINQVLWRLGINRYTSAGG